MLGVETLDASWRAARRADIYPGSRAVAALRFITGKDSLFSNRSMYAWLQTQGLTPANTFGNLGPVPFYVTATDLRTGNLHVFGDDPNDRVLDALMASTALTPFHPPWEVNGERYVDGGTITSLPIRAALERGATEVYALHITDSDKENQEPRLYRGVVRVMTRSVDTMLRLQPQYDLHMAKAAQIKLHYIKLPVPHPVPVADFSMADDLIPHGYKVTQQYLETHLQTLSDPEPDVESPSATRRFTMALSSWFTPRRAYAHAEQKQ
jgi:NTE family protein